MRSESPASEKKPPMLRRVADDDPVRLTPDSSLSNHLNYYAWAATMPVNGPQAKWLRLDPAQSRLVTGNRAIR